MGQPQPARPACSSRASIIRVRSCRSFPVPTARAMIEALGEGCRRLKIGDRVVVHFFPGWIAGEPDMAKLSTALGGPGGDGTLQQTLVVAEQALVRLPDADFDAGRGDFALRGADRLGGDRRIWRRQAGRDRADARHRRRLAVRGAIRQNARRARRRDDVERSQGGAIARARRRPCRQLSRRARLGAPGARSCRRPDRPHRRSRRRRYARRLAAPHSPRRNDRADRRALRRQGRRSICRSP